MRPLGPIVRRVAVSLPFRVVVDFVNRSLLSSHTHLLQRSMSMQRYLMDGLLASNPREVVIDRVAELTQGTAMLYRHDGTVLVPAGGAANCPCRRGESTGRSR